MPKRKKGCYNLECQRYRKEYRYDEEENYCSICGSKLVYVCAKCYEKIAEDSTSHLCKKHEDDYLAKQEKMQKGVQNVQEAAKKGAGAVAAAAPVAVNLFENKKLQKYAKKAVKLVKK